MEVTEGAVTVEVPEQSGEGVEGAVFFNTEQELNRDLTVAALRAYRGREPRAETYLDATCASGVRGVRAAADGWDATLVDRDPAAVDLARENLARNGVAGDVLHDDANAVLWDPEDAYDVVDLDPFGTPAPFLDATFANARDLVCVTATDTAPLCGAHFDSGVRKYGIVPRNTEYHAEMGVRVLLAAMARSAARFDVGVTPLLTHATRHYVRTYVDLTHSASAANDAIDALGHVYHCPECLWREHEAGLHAARPDACPNCGGRNLLTAGPIWLGATHADTFLDATRDALDDDMGTAETAASLLDTIENELDRPTHYDQHKLYGRWSEPAVAMDDFLAALRDAGFEASRTHYGGTTFETDASVAEIRDAAP
ncbi:tRNA (guanine(26)-N(2))-dimethyltransferase [Halarchaeum nitratireducens]|uniref:tRNA (guanine(26)-N(2))-dimethyltransferase n=1 Tax=Halarchaeum nitratireducens TaxID=489913 RepID=A0A830G9M5_9EURY|nr:MULTISPECIES: tRNA (guanine(26)-N(2))-dimethyltransferase [Halarchaeum]MBP2250348.1 tRNA (guanine26-N2/guanine27-N2)-dimethyltransferase [Halarchaeum solikamskense]GGN12858.1 tRNA (guanine(10)-N(2))-dimethyltransferase [Halarchaeum nitratireducens]